jgi:Arc/MetJ family transcription regulator
LVYREKRGFEEMARTNIELDDGLVEKAMRLTGARTKREVVDIALRRLVERGSLYRAIRRLQGKLSWEGDVDAWRTDRVTRTS